MAQDVLNTASFLIAIGGSAGSLEVLLKLLPNLKLQPLTAAIIILHRKNDTDSLLTSLLDSKSPHPVKEAEDKEQIIAGNIYIAPSDYHLLIESNFAFSLDDSEKVNYSRPSIDVTFEAAAYVFRQNLLCVLLSGANADGTEGLKHAKQYNSKIMIQRPDTAIVSFMPQHALENVATDTVFAPESLFHLLSQYP